jgi:hypothetical protein
MSAAVALALCLFVGRFAGYLVGFGTVAAFSAVLWSISCRKRRLARITIGCFGVCAFWFLAVDESVFIEECPDCTLRKIIFEYRLLTLPVYKTVHKSRTDIDRALSDLGIPCAHDENSRYHKCRLWGFVLPGFPNIKGAIWLTANDYYTAEIARTFRERSLADPTYARQLHNRVINQHDYGHFYDELHR